VTGIIRASEKKITNCRGSYSENKETRYAIKLPTQRLIATPMPFVDDG
jgi:hypothetical protein